MNPAKGFSSNPKEKKNPGVFKRRSGLMKAFIGSNHIVQHEKRNMQFHVKEYSRHPDANVEVICLNCCKKYESYEAMRKALEEIRDDWPGSDSLEFFHSLCERNVTRAEAALASADGQSGAKTKGTP